MTSPRIRHPIVKRWIAGIGLATFCKFVMAAGPPVSKPKQDDAAPERIDAIHVKTQVDDGPGTAVREKWDYWSVRGRGHRTDQPTPVDIYNAVKKIRYAVDPFTFSLTETKADDDLMVLELLRRGDARRNLDVLTLTTRPNQPGYKDETILKNGQEFRRISATDEQGRPVVAEIDTRRNRMLRTETWIHPQDKERPARVIRTYDYPPPESIAPGFFEPPANALVRIPIADDAQQRTSCAMNLRNLGGLIFEYAGKHADAMPASLADLKDIEGFKPSMLECPTSYAERPAPYAYRAREAGIVRIDDLQMETVLVECTNHAGHTVRVFGGGHAMVDAPAKTP